MKVQDLVIGQTRRVEVRREGWPKGMFAVVLPLPIYPHEGGELLRHASDADMDAGDWEYTKFQEYLMADDFDGWLALPQEER